jgi:hypothetical protein
VNFAVFSTATILPQGIRCASYTSFFFISSFVLSNPRMSQILYGRKGEKGISRRQANRSGPFTSLTSLSSNLSLDATSVPFKFIFACVPSQKGEFLFFRSG